MNDTTRPQLVPRLWPQDYNVVDLDEATVLELCSRVASVESPPLAMLRHGNTTTLIAPATEIPTGAQPVAPVQCWRAVSLEGATFPAASRVLGKATAVLGEVGIPVLAAINGHELLLLVPQELLGRALSALNQANLERLL